MYEYGDIKDARVGDVVEALITNIGETITKGKLYVIVEGSSNGSIGHYIEDNGEATEGIFLIHEYWKLVKTKPASEAKKGDEVIRVSMESHSAKEPIGTIHKATNINNRLECFDWNGWNIMGSQRDSFRVLCKAESNDIFKEVIAPILDSAQPNVGLNTNEEETMNTVEIKVNGVEVTTHTKPAKVLTALESRKKYTGVLYTEGGVLHSRIYANSEKKLNKLFNSSKYRDMIMVVQKEVNTRVEDRRFTTL
jgi:hypothetical protein